VKNKTIHIFRYKVDKIFVAVSCCVLSFLGLLVFQTITLDSGSTEDFVILLIISVFCLFLFTAIQFGTYCKIQERNLIVYVCFFPRRISISTIRSLEMNTSYFVGLRTSFRKGLIINFNRFEDFYITPKEELKFVTIIQSMNEFVLVKGNKKEYTATNESLKIE
jgi:Bacterial PH domain